MKLPRLARLPRRVVLSVPAAVAAAAVVATAKPAAAGTAAATAEPECLADLLGGQ